MRLLKPKEVVEKYDVSYEQLAQWESNATLHPRRTRGGHRRFNEYEIRLNLGLDEMPQPRSTPRTPREIESMTKEIATGGYTRVLPRSVILERYGHSLEGLLDKWESEGAIQAHRTRGGSQRQGRKRYIESDVRRLLGLESDDS
ncbi:MerR family transcriptional regulator [Thermodesulfobacteriota bacterium]